MDSFNKPDSNSNNKMPYTKCLKFPFHVNLCEKVQFSCVVVATVFLSLPYGARATEITNNGAIIDVNSRIGKEEKTTMKMAVRKFNNHVTERNLSLHFKDSQGGPIKVAYAVEKLLKERKVKLIVGMERWEDAALVADVRRQAQVLVVSFSAPSITTPFTHLEDAPPRVEDTTSSMQLVKQE